MFIRSLTPEERERVFREHAVPDLHPIDIKSFDYMEMLRRQGLLRVLGLFEDTELLGYAYIDRIPGLSVQLLDLFAVTRGHRGEGIGSRFLKLLTEQERFSPALIAEVEDPDAAEGDEQALDARRIAFYERAGWRDTGVKVRVAQYHCRLYAPSETLNEGTVRRDMQQLYHAVVGEDYTAKNIEIY